MKMNLDKRITKRKFNNLIDNGELTVSKGKIAKHFGMSMPTLHKWMRKNGYEDLIVGMRGRQSTRLRKTIKDGGKKIDLIQEIVGSMNYIAYNKHRDEEIESSMSESIPEDFEFELAE